MKRSLKIISLCMVLVMLFAALPMIPSVSAKVIYDYRFYNIKEIEFFALRDLYADIEESPTMGIGANITLHNGDVYFCDLGYDYQDSYLKQHPEVIDRETLLHFLSDNHDIQFKPRHSTNNVGKVDVNIVMIHPGTVYPEPNFQYNKSVTLNVVKNPVDSIEVLVNGSSYINKGGEIGYYSFQGVFVSEKTKLQINYTDGNTRIVTFGGDYYAYHWYKNLDGNNVIEYSDYYKYSTYNGEEVPEGAVVKGTPRHEIQFRIDLSIKELNDPDDDDPDDDPDDDDYVYIAVETVTFMAREASFYDDYIPLCYRASVSLDCKDWLEVNQYIYIVGDIFDVYPISGCSTLTFDPEVLLVDAVETKSGQTFFYDYDDQINVTGRMNVSNVDTVQFWCKEPGVATIRSEGTLSFIKPVTPWPPLSGTQTSFLDPAGTVTIQLLNEDNHEYGHTLVYGNNCSYSIPYVYPGTFILRASKKNHVTRDYEITVSGDTDRTQDIELHPIGDIDGDGEVTNYDYGRVNSHAKGKSKLTGYEFLCGDVDGDGEITNFDAGKVNSHARGKSSLWS